MIVRVYAKKSYIVPIMNYLINVVLRDYFKGATAPSLCFYEFQTDAQF